MKTLYISDLDGTLFNNNAELSDFTIKTINSFTEKGGLFSAASARTFFTAMQILKPLKPSIPLVLMNGVMVYDLLKEEALNVYYFSDEAVKALNNALEKHNMTGFLYTFENNEQYTYYTEIFSDHAREFIELRIDRYNKEFKQVKSFRGIENVIYFSVAAEREKIEPLYKELKDCSELSAEFYRDVYNEGFWYLEFSSKEASKKNAVLWLKEKYNIDKIVSFGDNYNDLSMFEISDECYAVSNAKEDVKKAATAVIDSNINDGVVKWILENAF